MGEVVLSVGQGVLVGVGDVAGGLQSIVGMSQAGGGVDADRPSGSQPVLKTPVLLAVAGAR